MKERDLSDCAKALKVEGQWDEVLDRTLAFVRENIAAPTDALGDANEASLSYRFHPNANQVAARVSISQHLPGG